MNFPYLFYRPSGRPGQNRNFTAGRQMAPQRPGMQRSGIQQPNIQQPTARQPAVLPLNNPSSAPHSTFSGEASSPQDIPGSAEPARPAGPPCSADPPRPADPPCSTDLPCPAKPTCPPAPETFSFFTIMRDFITKEPLEGAAYALCQTGFQIGADTSDSQGILRYKDLFPGIYELKEIQTPAAYQADDAHHIVKIERNGRVLINNTPADQYSLFDRPLPSLRFQKTDADSKAALPGAVFMLDSGVRAISDATGTVDFGIQPAGNYILTEAVPPPGYQADTARYQITVSADGLIQADGTDIGSFCISNKPAHGVFFAFHKYDSYDGHVLQGAAFNLSDGKTAISDKDGLVDFGEIALGTYTMREIAVPVGYELSDTIYNVTAAAGGEITVNGAPAANFSVYNNRLKASVPTVEPAYEGDCFLRGFGIPGATFTLTLPNNQTIDTVVAGNRFWFLMVPNGVKLHAGDVLSAYQTQEGYYSSDVTTVNVLSRR